MSRYSTMSLQEFRIELFVPEAAHLLNIYRHLIEDLEVVAAEYEDAAGGKVPSVRDPGAISYSYCEILERAARTEKAMSEMMAEIPVELMDRRQKAVERMTEAWATLRARYW
jgi:hypothetical protein